jgi:hypothetical protein
MQRIPTIATISTADGSSVAEHSAKADILLQSYKERLG